MKNQELYNIIIEPFNNTHYEKQMNKDFLEFLVDDILPIYNGIEFDKGHNLTHILDVINRTSLFILEKDYNIDINVAIAAAALHDIGIIKGRKNHAKYSGEIIRQIDFKNHFTKQQIEIIAQAAEQHSTSLKQKPYTIYGQLVCDADKDSDINIYIMRSIEFAKQYNPQFTQQEIIDDVFNDLCRRFGVNGKVEFYLNINTTLKYVDEARKLTKNYKKFVQQINKIMKFMNIQVHKKDPIKCYQESPGGTLDEKIHFYTMQNEPIVDIMTEISNNTKLKNTETLTI